MKYKYSIDKIPFPEKEDLTPEQINLLENYKAIAETLIGKENDQNSIDVAISLLTKLFYIFDEKKQKKYRNWYQYQVTLIDPLLGPCAKISELITKASVKSNQVGLSQDGKNFLLAFENTFATTQFLELLKEEMPGLDYKVIKFAYEKR